MNKQSRKLRNWEHRGSTKRKKETIQNSSGIQVTKICLQNLRELDSLIHKKDASHHYIASIICDHRYGLCKEKGKPE